MTDNSKYTIFYPHAPARVWHALSSPEALAEWLLPGNFEPRVGFQFRLEGEELSVTGEVIEVVPGERLVYTWDDGESGAPSVVEWNLTPSDGGTLLSLEHVLLTPAEPVVLLEAQMNWGGLLAHGLPAMLRRVPPTPIVYAQDTPDTAPKLARAGFRQEDRS